MTAGLLRDRILAILLLCLALGAVFAVLMLPGLRAGAAARAQATELMGMIALAERRGDGTAQISDQLATLERVLAEHPARQPDEDAGLTGARLQSELRALIDGAGGSVSQTSAGSYEIEHGITVLPLRLQFTGDDHLLRQVIHALDYDRPDLRMRSLSLRTLRTRDPSQYLAMDMTVTAIIGLDTTQ